MVRVRFAPSPTGFLHIGSARTALFNWLFARNMKGKFILRIEDTDVARSSKEAVEQILSSLEWLGLNWDEGPKVGGSYGPYYQSQRLEIYREFSQKLLKEGKAYPCYCTEEELEERRAKMREKKEMPRYDGRCRNLSESERKRLEEEGRKHVIRLKWDKPVDSIEDLIHGRISFKEHQFDDFIIVKADGTPTYNFSCVIDDYLMKITHVIRGDDHITNTPRQIALYEALALPLPQFAHIPLILGPDRSRLSKRHGAVDLLEYRREGYLPDALINFLALLGWSPGENRELFTRDELISRFSLERITRRNAIFNREKLDWMNGQYIKRLSTEEFATFAIPFLKDSGYLKGRIDEKWLREVLELYKPRTRVFSQIVEKADYLFLDEPKYDEEAVEKFLKRDYIPSLLQKIKTVLEETEPFNPEQIETNLRNLIEKLNISVADFVHPLRVVVTGKADSPPLFHVMSLLGKEKTLKRLKRIQEKGFGEEGKVL